MQFIILCYNTHVLFRFEYTDEDFLELLENLDYIFTHFGYQQPSIFFSFMEPVDFSAQVLTHFSYFFNQMPLWHNTPSHLQSISKHTIILTPATKHDGTLWNIDTTSRHTITTPQDRLTQLQNFIQHAVTHLWTHTTRHYTVATSHNMRNANDLNHSRYYDHTTHCHTFTTSNNPSSHYHNLTQHFVTL